MAGNKVVGFDGKSTPQTSIAAISEHLDEIEGMTGVILWKGGKQSVFCTDMPSETITWLVAGLDTTMRNRLFPRTGDGYDNG